MLRLSVVFLELIFNVRRRAYSVVRPISSYRQNIGVAYVHSFKIDAILHDHKHGVLLHLAVVEEGVILVILVWREHALGEESLQVCVEIVPLVTLVLLGRLHRLLEAEILYFKRLAGYYLNKSVVLKIRVRRKYLGLRHV